MAFSPLLAILLLESINYDGYDIHLPSPLTATISTFHLIFFLLFKASVNTVLKFKYNCTLYDLGSSYSKQESCKFTAVFSVWQVGCIYITFLAIRIKIYKDVNTAVSLSLSLSLISEFIAYFSTYEHSTEICFSSCAHLTF